MLTRIGVSKVNCKECNRENREETREQVNDIEVTKRIKAIDPGARIVIVTDYDDGELRRAAMDAGA